MKPATTTLFLTAIFFLYACSPNANDEKPEGVLTTSQKETLKKAEQLEGTLKAVDDKRLQELNDAGEK